LARIESIVGDSITKVSGNLLVYFQKGHIPPRLGYGSRLFISRPLQQITNSGNPGGFNYQQYCGFRDIYHQVFLREGDFYLLPPAQKHWFQQTLLRTKAWVLSVIRRYIKGKDESAVAEALLIGYREDLDKELVQSYSNTGVVHIIAISGLHLGMIYGAMLWLFHPFRRRQLVLVLRPAIVILVLWMFTFIAGAVPSILRSAVMFTCIVGGEVLSRRTSIYNTLAVSAFILLLVNPFFLWDIGFQLSFAAVLSIVAFSKHLGNLWWFKNKLLNNLWRLSSVTLAAQLLTLPLVLYHFHQFPNLFLLTNVVIVPLSGLILFSEILLLCCTILPGIATAWGSLIEWCIGLMNDFILRTDRLPFAVTDGINITVLQSLLVYAMIICCSTWLIRKKKGLFVASLAFLGGYVAIRSVDISRVRGQQKVIVYNVPQHTAIDVMEGNKYVFIGDSALYGNAQLINYHLRPSRIIHRVAPGNLHSVAIDSNMIASQNVRVAIIDGPVNSSSTANRVRINVIVVTRNPQLYIDQLTRAYDFDLLVFDSSNPSWKIRLWKKDCDSLHLRHHSVPDQGAFEMDL
jgi:competence protein ComEC